MSTSVTTGPNEPRQSEATRARVRRTVWVTATMAVCVVVACSYGLLSANPYRGISEATRVSARAQDALSLVVVPVLLIAATRGGRSRRAHLVWLGLVAYLAYSYAIYLIGLPMNRCFLVYVAIELLAGAALIDGVVRLRPAGWMRCPSRRLERGTGWFLVVTGSLFAALWLTVLVPFAFGGPEPTPQGPAVRRTRSSSWTLSSRCRAWWRSESSCSGPGRRTPLAVVVLVKIVTLFTVLWAGVAVQAMTDVPVHLEADAGPSALLLAVSGWLTLRWLGHIRAGDGPFVRDTLWELDSAGRDRRASNIRRGAEMKALRLRSWQNGPALEEVPVPSPGTGEVLVRVGGAGACHSDLHLMYEFPPGTVPWTPPFTLGHENAGWVQELGEGVDGLEVGQPVAVGGGVGLRALQPLSRGTRDVLRPS
jgi:hypothetical protein